MATKRVQPVRAHEILYALSRRHGRDLWFTEVKDGPTQTGMRQMDGLAVARSWAHMCLTGYEVKVSRSDFMRDTKWPAYKDLTHFFSFACPTGIIQPEDLPDTTVGLIWYKPETGGLRTVRKALFRPHEPDALMLYYLLIYRAEGDRHPFFSDTREMLRSWVQNKATDRELGDKVKTKLVTRLVNTQQQLDHTRDETTDGRHALDRLMAVTDYLTARGVADAWELQGWGTNWRRVLDEAFGGVSSPAAVRSLRRARDAIDQVITAAEGDNAEKVADAHA